MPVTAPDENTALDFNDLGIEGVTLSLFQSNELIAAAATDSLGAHSFDGLASRTCVAVATDEKDALDFCDLEKLVKEVDSSEEETETENFVCISKPSSSPMLSHSPTCVPTRATGLSPTSAPTGTPSIGFELTISSNPTQTPSSKPANAPSALLTVQPTSKPGLGPSHFPSTDPAKIQCCCTICSTNHKQSTNFVFVSNNWQ